MIYSTLTATFICMLVCNQNVTILIRIHPFSRC